MLLAQTLLKLRLFLKCLDVLQHHVTICISTCRMAQIEMYISLDLLLLAVGVLASPQM